MYQKLLIQLYSLGCYLNLSTFAFFFHIFCFVVSIFIFISIFSKDSLYRWYRGAGKCIYVRERDYDIFIVTHSSVILENYHLIEIIDFGKEVKLFVMGRYSILFPSDTRVNAESINCWEVVLKVNWLLKYA